MLRLCVREVQAANCHARSGDAPIRELGAVAVQRYVDAAERRGQDEWRSLPRAIQDGRVLEIQLSAGQRAAGGLRPRTLYMYACMSSTRQ